MGYVRGGKKRIPVRYQKTGAYYNAGSVAYDDVHSVEEPVTTSKQRKTKQVVSSKARQVLERRANRIYALKIFLAVAVIFVGCMAWMGMRATLMQQRIHLRDYQEKLATIKNENAMTLAEISQQMDLDTVKEKAQKDLGMAKPQGYQIIYIDVPKQSYTVEYDQQTQVASNTSLPQKIFDFLKKD